MTQWVRALSFASLRSWVQILNTHVRSCCGHMPVMPIADVGSWDRRIILWGPLATSISEKARKKTPSWGNNVEENKIRHLGSSSASAGTHVGHAFMYTHTCAHMNHTTHKHTSTHTINSEKLTWKHDTLCHAVSNVQQEFINALCKSRGACPSH